MEYFIIKQDQTIPNIVEPVGVLKVIDKGKIHKDITPKMDELAVQFEIKENKDPYYVDFIENPVNLVSDGFKDILRKFEDKTFFKPIVLADIKGSTQELYWFMVPNNIECLSSKSEFHKNGTIKRIVIDENKIGFSKIFRIKGILENIVIIRLDVAESILRRGLTGFNLLKVEKDC